MIGRRAVARCPTYTIVDDVCMRSYCHQTRTTEKRTVRGIDLRHLFRGIPSGLASPSRYVDVVWAGDFSSHHLLTDSIFAIVWFRFDRIIHLKHSFRMRQMFISGAVTLSSTAVQDAGAAYKQCGRLEERLNNPEVAASLYHEAALCFQKDDPQGA